MCYPLIKRNVKLLIKPLLALLMILGLYFGIIIYMYDPKLSDMLNDYQKMMPEMMAAFGMTGVTDTLLKFMNTYLYGFLMMLFPLIFIVLMGNHLLMKYEDEGSLVCLLASPYSRTRIIVTQGICMILSVAILMILVAGMGICFAQGMFPGELETGAYIKLNAFIILLQLSISGIVFCSACFFQDSKYYYMTACGIPLVFYLLYMIGNMGEHFSWMKKISIYNLFPANQIITGEKDVWGYALAMIAITVVCYIAGSIRFIKKDLFL